MTPSSPPVSPARQNPEPPEQLDIYCNHNQRAAFRVSESKNNPGRWYYCCFKGPYVSDRCRFFKWADTLSGPGALATASTPPSPNPTMSTPGPSPSSVRPAPVTPTRPPAAPPQPLSSARTAARGTTDPDLDELLDEMWSTPPPSPVRATGAGAVSEDIVMETAAAAAPSTPTRAGPSGSGHTFTPPFTPSAPRTQPSQPSSTPSASHISPDSRPHVQFLTRLSSTVAQAHKTDIDTLIGHLQRQDRRLGAASKQIEFQKQRISQLTDELGRLKEGAASVGRSAGQAALPAERLDASETRLARLESEVAALKAARR